MFIVSQDGKTVACSEKIYGISIEEREDDYSINITSDKFRDEMAVYKKEKTAQHVLELFMQAMFTPNKEKFEFPGDY